MTAFQEAYSSRELQTYGIDYVSRKAGVGVASPHQALSKSGSVKTLADFRFRPPVSNVDLAFVRGRSEAVISRPDYRDAAGSMGSSQRRLDMAPVLRNTCIEHQVRRMHSAPPPVRPDKGFTHTMSDCFEKISLVGRSSRWTPSPYRRSSRSSERQRPNARDRSMSRESELSLPESTALLQRASSQSSRRTFSVPPLNLTGMADAAAKSQDHIERTEVAEAQDMAPSPFGVFRVRNCHKGQDDQASLATTASSSSQTTPVQLQRNCHKRQDDQASLATTASTSSHTTTAQLQRPGKISSLIVLSATSNEGYASYSRLLGSRAASILEQRVKDRVMREQKKALQRTR